MRKLFVFASAMLLSAFASITYALGFGEIQLQSGLNQPLKAEIPLLAVKPAERDQVTVEIASIETFQRFGITRPAVLDQIDTRVLPGANNTRLRVTLNSRVPIQEPFLTFLLEANWPDGRAIREYTVLLDPPVYAPSVSAGTEQLAQEVAPAAPVQPAPYQQPVVQYAPPAAAPEPAPAPVVAQQPQAPQASPEPFEAQPSPAPIAQEPGRQYGPIEAKETLWSIALKMRSSPSITQNQMMLAIYQANPEAFDGNINLMRKGVILDIPSASDISDINVLAAKNEIRDQSRSYKAAATSSTQVAAKKKSAANLKPKLKPELKSRLKLEPATIEPNAEAPDTTVAAKTPDREPQLEPLTVAADDSSAQAPADANETTGESSDQQLLGDAAGERATESDAQTESPAQVAEASDTAAAQDQQPQSTPADPATNSDTSEAAIENSQGANTETNSETNPESKDGLEQLLSNGEDADNAKQTLPVAESDGEQISDATFAAANLDAEQGQKVPSENSSADFAASDPAVPAVSPAPAASQDQAQQTTTDSAAANDNRASTSDAFIPGESVADSDAAAFVSPQRVLLLLGVILLLVAMLIAWSRRKQKPATSDFSFKTDQGSDKTAAGLAATSAGVAAAAATSAKRAPVAPNVDAPTVDVDELLSDADSHITYELYDEALDALALGLAAHPDNSELQCKVLEVHHAAGDQTKFFAKLDEYFPSISSAHPQWPTVAQMAHELAPDDARFASVATHAQVQAQPPVQEPGQQHGQQQPQPAGVVDLDEVAPPSETTANLDDSTPRDTANEFEVRDDAGLDVSSAPLNLDDKNTDFDVADWESAETKTSDSLEVSAPKDSLASWADEAPKPDSSLTGVAASAGLAAASLSSDKQNTTEEPEDSFEFDLSDFDVPAAAPTKSAEPNPKSMSGAEAKKDSETPVQDVSADSLDFDISELELSDSDSDSGSSMFDTKAPEAETPNTQPSSDPFSEQDSAGSDDLDWPEGFGIETKDDIASEVSVAPEPSISTAPPEQTQPERTQPEQPRVQGAGMADVPTPKVTPAPSDDLRIEEISDNAADSLDGDEPISDESGGFDGDNSSADIDDDEVLTKLDLARAYIDMGEEDMAQSLLQDVQAQGNAEQQREAQTLLDRGV